MISLFDIRYTEFRTKFFTRGDIILVPNAQHKDNHAYLVYDPVNDDRTLGLINMVGYKAGLIYVIFPKESRGEYADSYGPCLSWSWLKENWNEWVALGHYKDAIFLRERGRVQDQ